MSRVIAVSDWYLYIIRCGDGTLYTGISTDIERRFAEHREGGNAGSKYLKGRGPLILLFCRKLGGRSLALKVENMVKKLPKAKKEQLVCVPEYIEEIIKEAAE